MKRRESKRNSLSFSTSQLQTYGSEVRKSLSALDMDCEKNPNEVLFETLMNDPIKRACLLKILANGKGKTKAIKKNEMENRSTANQSPLRKLQRKFVCESPTALLRRRALEKNDENVGTPNKIIHTSIVPTALPFERLLEGVVAYAELRGKDGDRSAGAKALMQLMGAVVSDHLTKDVTHVIFKDGSFNTYQKAKLMKKHLVSVLWLEAVRKNHYRVPESQYPALGTEVFDVDVSAFCQELQKDYEDMVQDELRLSISSKKNRKSLCTPHLDPIDELPSSPSTNCSASADSTSARSLISCISLYKNKTPDSLRLQNSTPEFTSDSDSELGLVNGCSSNTIKDSLQLPQINKVEKSTTGDNSLTSNNTSSIPRTSTSTNESGVNVSSESTSLLSHNLNKRHEKTPNTPRRRTLYNYVSVEEALGISEKKKSKRHLTYINSSDETDVNVNIDLTAVNKECKIKKNSKKNLHNDFSDVTHESVGNEVPSITEISSDNSKEVTNKSTDQLLLQLPAEKLSKGITFKASDKSLFNDTLNRPASRQLKEDSCKTPRRNEKRKTIHVDEDMELTNIVTDKDTLHNSITPKSVCNDFITKRKRTSQSNLPVDSVNVLHDTNITSLIIQSSTDNSKKNKSSSTEELSSLRLSLDKSNENSGRKSSINDKNSKENTNKILPLLNEIEQVKSPYTKKLCHKSFESDNSPFHSFCGDVSNLINDLDLSSPEKPVSNTASCKNKTILKKSKKKVEVLLIETTEKNIAITTDLEKDVLAKQRKVRKLYNMNEEIPPLFGENEDIIKKSTVEHVFKEPHVRLTSLMLTPNARKYVENIKSKVISSSTGRKDTDKRNENKTIGKRNENKTTDKRNENKTTDKRNQNKTTDQRNLNKTPDKKSVINIKSERKRNCDTNLPSHESNKEKENKKKKHKTPNLKVPTQIRKSPRKNIKPGERFESESSNTSDSVGIVPRITRRSTLDFVPQQPIKTAGSKLTQSNKSIKKTGIVCTRFHNPEVQVFQQIVRKLGVFFTEDDVTSKTSHLVVGEAKRTVNILRAIARGCWILKAEWLYKSLEEGKWLSEEDYELTEFSDAVQKSRQQRQAFGHTYSLDIFYSCDPIYVSKSSSPRCSDLQELITMCKGTVTTVKRNASICIGEFDQRDDVTCVTENWLLDSITFNRKKSFRNYLIKGPSVTQSRHF